MTTKTLPNGVTAKPLPSPNPGTIPFAVALPPANPDHVQWDADLQSVHGKLYEFSGDVDLRFHGRRFQADLVQYNEETQELQATGHVRLSDAANDESMQASRATYNLRTGTGRFYDAAGSVGLHRAPAGPAAAGRFALQNSNPFLFSGRVVEKTGPADYTIYDGTVTSCLLPRPDWLFAAHRFAVSDGKVHSAGATFRLLGLPILFLPYLSAPAAAEQRQSGLLIPELPSQSTTKGIMTGEQVYFALGRSADLTMGLQYFSQRGFAESGTFRYRGNGLDFAAVHGSALQDRGYYPTPNVYVQQGGEDVAGAFRKQLSTNIRAVGDAEYLSSYIYREAFTSNFNQAVSSDITSIAFVTRQTDGWSADARVDRYQGLKRAPLNSSPGAQVHILHAPSFDLDGVDRPLAGTPLRWTLNGSVAGLKRAQPNFTSSGIAERVDVRPELSLPLHFDGWSLRGSVATRETFYSRSRKTPYPAGVPPIELTTPVNRADLETEVALRPPAIERDFKVPQRFAHLFGTAVRHTVEPEMTYRDVRGVGNFQSILRFDETDLVSDTNELEYGVTQHLYFRPVPRPPPTLPEGCPGSIAEVSSPPQAGGASGEAAAQAGPLAPVTPPGRTGSSPSSPDEQVPDVLDPTPADSTDANGIPSPAAAAPDLPLRTHPRHVARCVPPPNTAQQPLLSWRLTQRVFFDPTFGHAEVTHRRNVLETTLSLSGIAFLTEPRNISPLISRLRLRTSGHTDVEWDFDLDTGAKKFNSSNLFFDAHEGNWFGGMSYARLNAPGRFATEVIDTNQNASLVTSPVSNFSQLRVLLGYGVPTKPGLSVAGNAGVDLLHGNTQYLAVQTGYNWNCCGLAVEYRRYNLGTVRDENAYRFNFTLANIGAAGNLRRAERLF